MDAREIPLPPQEIRMGGSHFVRDEDFVTAARSDVRTLVELCELKPTSSVLDVGCGPGRLPIGLLHELGGIRRYVGVDVQHRHIEWCSAHLNRPEFAFILIDAVNERYNPDGAGGFALPEDEQFDVIHAYSLLSHMRSDDVSNYLFTFRHHLCDEGRIFVTAFVEPDVPDETENPAGYGPIPWTKPLHCVRYSDRFFSEMVARAGLAIEVHQHGAATDGQSSFVLSALGGKGRLSGELMRSLADEGLARRRMADLQRHREELMGQVATYESLLEDLTLKRAERDEVIATLRVKLKKSRKAVRQRDRRIAELQERLALANNTLRRRSVRGVIRLANLVPRRSAPGDNVARPPSNTSPTKQPSTRQPTLEEPAAVPVAARAATVVPSGVEPEANKQLGVSAGTGSERIEATDLVVYTALVGGYDALASVEHLREGGTSFVCFSDVEQPVAKGWEIRPLSFYSNDQKRTALFVKTHPHLFFGDAEVSMWIDASITLSRPPHLMINDSGLGEAELSAFLHPDRHCVVEEADEVVRLGLDVENVVFEQMMRYEAAGFPKECQPYETGVLIRRHNLPKIVDFDELWWAELEGGSRRDQLSFAYVAWKAGLNVAPLAPPGVSVRNHPDFVKRKHLVQRRFRPPRNTEEAIRTRKRWNIRVSEPSASKSTPDGVGEDVKVDVVVPIHNALAHVQRCVRSLERDPEWSGRMLLVDDGSEIETKEWCEAFARDRDRVVLIRHDQARGFSGACNAGIAASTSASVVVLNSDTVVSRGWTRRMHSVLSETPAIGMVGPLSNAASWQSIPRYRDHHGLLAVNALPAGVSLEEMNEFLGQLSRGLVTPLVSTLNGFCLMLRRELLDVVGGFDEATFPRGYGEEVDLALRATDAGFLLAVATDTYVFHAKSQSFGTAARDQLKIAGRDALVERYGEHRLNRIAASTRQHPVLEFLREVTEELFSVQ